MNKLKLKNFYLPERNPRANIYWGMMFCLFLSVVTVALYQSLSFSAFQFGELSIFLIISALLNKYRKRIPGTQTDISAKEMMLFWGVIWLGVPGAVLIAVGTSLARFESVPKTKKYLWLFDVFVNTVSVWVAASVFYLSLYLLEGFTGTTAADSNLISNTSLIIAASIMAITHFWLFSILSSVYLNLEKKHEFSELWRRNLVWMVGVYLVGLGAAFILHIIFIRFGVDFGLIMLPIVGFAHFAYRIHLRRLEQKVKEIKEASRIHLATVEALATAIDARDQIGIGHVRRTQIYAVGIGEILGLAEDEIQALNTGALLHDIGKLAIPDNILNKPGKLTIAEKEKTKIHSLVGASILEDINFPYPVVHTVKYHHEMWNGKGYPKGLAGKEIPITARILAVADAYDSLRTSRPYRAAFSREKARAFMLGSAGIQFDPNIVDIFLRNLRQLEARTEAENISYSQATGNNNLLGNNSYVEHIKSANREVFTLYELARVFSSSLNMEDTLSLFAQKIGELIQFDTCAIYLLDKSQVTASVAFCTGINSEALQNKQIEVGKGATGCVLKNRKPGYDMKPSLDFAQDQFNFVEDYSAMASMPLINEGNLIGAVSIYSCETSKYVEEQIRLFETISRIASDAISMVLQHAESEVRALTDPLTELPNARSLQLHFEKEVGRASRSDKTFQLLMLDLDGFKSINDTYGHKVGDALLKELAKVMQSQLRDYDFLARYAGDEFVVIVPETENIDVLELCERMEQSICEFKLKVGKNKFASVGASLGAACYPYDGETIDQVIIAADKKMYEVKAKRKLKQNMPDEPSTSKNKVKRTRPKSRKMPDSKAQPYVEFNETEDYIVELDESNIISNAIN